MICQQCGTENENASKTCQRCGRLLRSADVRGLVTCKNHGNRASIAICYQCLKPICEECAVVKGNRTFCIDDAHLNVVEDEEERIEQLAVGDPSVLQHADFTSRLSSFLIDVAILTVVAVLLVAVFWLFTGVVPVAMSSPRLNVSEIALFWCIFLLIVLAYNVVLVASDGQTFGKQAMRIAIVESDGTTPSFSLAICRWAYSLVSVGCFGLGCFAVIRDPAKQAWHDRWANTYVISLDDWTESSGA